MRIEKLLLGRAAADIAAKPSRYRDDERHARESTCARKLFVKLLAKLF